MDLGHIKMSEFRKEISTPSGQPYRFRDPVVFEAGVIFTQIPNAIVAVATPGATTPSILNSTSLKLAATGATTLTNFMNGAQGQLLAVFGDGNTTVTHGTKIFTNTGANKLLAVNRVYVFHFRDSIWYEH